MNVATATRVLQSQSGLSPEASSAIVETIVSIVDDRTRDLVTEDHLDMRVAGLTAELEKLRGELRAEIANQTKWLFGGLLGTAGLIVAFIRLVP